MKTIAALALLPLLALSTAAQAIDFETLPSGAVPADEAPIQDQFSSLGVRFSLVMRCADPLACRPPAVLASQPESPSSESRARRSAA